MDLTDYVKIARRRWRLIAACGIVALLVAWITSLSGTTGQASSQSYRATATLVQDPSANRPLVYTALLVTRGPVPQRVAAALHYPGAPALLAAGVNAKANLDTGTLDITAQGASGPRTAAVANEFAKQLDAYFRDSAAQKLKAQRDTLRRQIDAMAADIAQLRQTNDGTAVASAELDAQTSAFQGLVRQLADLSLQAPQSGLSVLEPATAIPQSDGGGIAAPGNGRKRLAIGAVLGLLLGAGLTLVLERFDTRLRSRTATESSYRAPVVAEVPELPRRARHSHEPVTVSMPGSAAAEAFRSLRSSLFLLQPRVIPSRTTAEAPGAPMPPPHPSTGKPQVIVVTSALPDEGKTTTAVNVAACLAETGKRVLVVDCDLRHPGVHLMLGVPQSPGLAEALGSADVAATLADSIRDSAVPGVQVLPAGGVTARPATLLGALPTVLASARDRADVVVVDSAPLIVTNDTTDLLPHADAVLVVCRNGRTTVAHAEMAAELLARTRAPVLGVALLGSTEAPTAGSHYLGVRPPAWHPRRWLQRGFSDFDALFGADSHDGGSGRIPDARTTNVTTGVDHARPKGRRQ